MLLRRDQGPTSTHRHIPNSQERSNKDASASLVEYIRPAGFVALWLQNGEGYAKKRIAICADGYF